MMESNSQSRIVGQEDDLEPIQVTTQDFELDGPDVGNEEDPPLRPMVYPEFESLVEKLMTRGVPTGTRKISFTGDHTGDSVPTNLPYYPVKTTWKRKKTVSSRQLQMEPKKEELKRGLKENEYLHLLYQFTTTQANQHIIMELNNVVNDDKRLIGEISSSTLAYFDEAVAAAITTLSSSDLMAYIDCGGPPDNLIGLVKMRLQEKKLGLRMELMDEEFPASSSSSLALSCSSNDESRLSKNVSGRSSARWSDTITCYPGNSLVTVLI
ncbi:hypothetical protein BC332_18690 [Capsicum chinense]|nr:hypothetical protein BC332_18690 [Capsicum chinense]